MNKSHLLVYNKWLLSLKMLNNFKMNNTRILFIKIVAILFSFNCVYPQIISQGEGQVVGSSNIGFIRGNHLPDSFLNSKNKSIEYKDIEGSPYVNNNLGHENNLPIGKIHDRNNTYINTVFVRYNAFTDNMEVSLIDDGVNYYILKKETNFLYIILKDKKYRAYQYNDNNNLKFGYFIILNGDDNKKCFLLKKEKVVYEEKKESTNSFLTSTPPRFRRLKDELFIKIENEIFKIPKKNKHFFSYFKENRKFIEDFIIKNKLKVSKQKDLISVVKYYNDNL